MIRTPFVLPARPWNGLRLLDLCCKAGGASMGFYLAGFDVVGVDKAPQRRYPFEFIQADALDVLADRAFIAGFDVLAGGPPCQAHTLAQRIQGREHPDLIPGVRAGMQASGLPHVIENVPGAPLRNPVELCGCMFTGLGVYRERLFEFGNWPGITQPAHRPHTEPLVKLGRPPRPGHRMHVVGNFSGVAQARKAMGIAWMTRDELREAIPPAYTRHIGTALATHLAAGPAAGRPAARTLCQGSAA
ncbi:DNA cytosine methyltransferase [Actinomadura montaniterrae]|uniref:DNA cytosine methyltransferase n=1 Tax=Actinomadura montaniterrae TaxID=1803903 RepID=A0A6L3VP88_9ACTN|nr:DNA cytosine methyltransferase [Actinomadura montaniterrae]KAB2365209.1 DNA cytosine methyltransferase [Actinomadura montaniterrae]